MASQALWIGGGRSISFLDPDLSCNSFVTSEIFAAAAGCGSRVGSLKLKAHSRRKTLLVDNPRMNGKLTWEAVNPRISREITWLVQSPTNSRKTYRLDVRAGREVTGSVLRGEGLRFAVVAARFNEIITRPLAAGAMETFHKYAVKDEDVDVVWVPGSFEIPLVAQQLAKSGKYDAVLAIGAVIRGATTHYDAVAGSAASGLMSASLNSGVPVIFGILTTENMDQAIDRAGGKVGNKGAEAALTAIEMASLFKHHIVPLTGSESRS